MYANANFVNPQNLQAAVGTDDERDQTDKRDAHQQQEPCGSRKAPEASREAPARFSPPALGCPVDGTHTMQHLEKPLTRQLSRKMVKDTKEIGGEKKKPRTQVKINK